MLKAVANVQKHPSDIQSVLLFVSTNAYTNFILE